MRLPPLVLVCVLLVLGGPAARATVLPAGFAETTVAGGLTSPTAMVLAPDGRFFVAQQNGVVRVIAGGVLLPQPFVTLGADATGERGLLGITLDPDFATNHWVYVYYAASDILANRLSRLAAHGNVADPVEHVLAELPPYGGAIWHMGGALHFGGDGKLYVGVGDHQNTANPQSLANVFGKILRLERDGSVPLDNPFVDATSGFARAIWAHGLRNPFTFAFEPGTGRLMINDVGQEKWEEVNEGVAGANYGWPTTEGATTNPAFISPRYAYPHSEGCAVTGGAFYTPPVPTFPIAYVGGYFFADYCARWIRWLDAGTGAAGGFATEIAPSTVDLDAGADGNLYYLSRGVGAVRRIAYTASAAPQITVQPASQTVFGGDPVTFVVAASAATSYRWQRDGVDIPGATETSHTLPATTLDDDGAVFRAVAGNSFGETPSEDAVLTVTDNQAPVADVTLLAPHPLYRGGDEVAFMGTAADAEDGTLGPNAFTWRVDFHHHHHSHPFVPPTPGVDGGSFVIPVVAEVSPDVWYRVTLTVVDSGGRATTTEADIHPEVVSLALMTEPPGLRLELDDQPLATPYTTSAVVNLERTVGAPGLQLVEGTPYRLDHWSDGGAGRHTIVVPSGGTELTAYYVPVPPGGAVYVSDLPWTSATNGRGPTERDRSNGETPAGDGRPITLQGVVYPKGLGVHAPSAVTYDLDGRYATFLSDVGVDDEMGNNGSVIFEVWVDGERVAMSPVLTGASPIDSVAVDVTGKSALRLVVTTNGSTNADHADWADARLLVGTPPTTTTTTTPATTTTDTTSTTTTSTTTSTTAGTAPASTSSTTSTTAGTSATSTSSSTTTTIARPSSTTTTSLPPDETCGNCLDDDGDGLVDFDDSDCCGRSGAMAVRRSRLRKAAGGTRLRLRLVTGSLGTFDPDVDELHLQLAGGKGDTLCASIPAGRWRQRKRLSFDDRGHHVPSASGIERLVLRQLPGGQVRIELSGARVPFPLPSDGLLRVTLGLRDPRSAEGGNRCASVFGAFRPLRGGLRFP